MSKRKPLSIVINTLLGSALVLGASAASAYNAGDKILRVGVASVQPNDSSSELALDGSGISGSEAGVKSNEQLGITFTYMLSSDWGVEVLAATPFKHDIIANTGALGLGTVNAGSTKHLPPTFSLQYYPMDAASNIQPYVGIGVNYTKFFSEDVASDLEGVLGNGSLKLDDSIGLAFEAGIDYAINDKWQLNASVWYADIDTEATFKFDGGNTLKTDVSIDPLVSMISLSYRF